MIRVEHVNKKFGTFSALNDTNMHVEKGSIYGLVGANGAGKSTIIRHITGVYRPDSGSITIDGTPVYENPAVKERIAYIPDDLFYFTQANTLEMKRFYKSMYPKFNEKLFDDLKDCFPEIDVKRSIRRLSKGMQKQVAFWLSICTMPDVMILDEPVDGLDPVMRRQIWSLIMKETAEREACVLVSSHNLRELEDVCDHVGIMHKGSVILERSLENLQDSVFKIQVAFPNTEPSLPGGFEILHKSNIGQVYTLIVRGNAEDAQKYLQNRNPLMLELLPLTLEEIFIYEMGGMNYELKDILL